MPVATVKPITTRNYDRDISAYVSRVIGYGWTCSCGERSRVLRQFQTARSSLRVHKVTCPAWARQATAESTSSASV